LKKVLGTTMKKMEPAIKARKKTTIPMKYNKSRHFAPHELDPA
jgi:hypothetical protein